MLRTNADCSIDVVCDECGKRKITSAPSQNMAEECMYDDGWEVDAMHLHDVCPDCLEKRRMFDEGYFKALRENDYLSNKEKHYADYQHRRVMRRAINFYGNQQQILVGMEELSELQKELSKFARGENNQDHIAEEIADVLIMIEQVKMMAKVERSDINKWIEYKIKRLEDRLNLTDTE